MAAYPIYMVYGYDGTGYDVYPMSTSGSSPYASIVQGGVTSVMNYNANSTIFGTYTRMAEGDSFTLHMMDGDFAFDFHQATYTAASGELTASDEHLVDTTFYPIIL